MPGSTARAISSVATLDDPVRQALYRFVGGQQEAVSRDEAARAVDIGRPLAAYHLDRLVEAGLLEAEHRRPPGRSGPGAGRPAKLYRRAASPVEVSLPPRNYELVARLLVTAAGAGSAQPPPAVTEAARSLGSRLGAAARERSGPRPSKRRMLESLDAELEANGFEPQRQGGTITLRNCPFDALAKEHADLVCGMNLALLQGMVEGMGIPSLSAALDPAPGRCCVVLRSD